MHNNMGNVHVARGVDKTHKDGFNKSVGPPLRMIVAANEAPNSQISENLCDILKPLADKMDERKKTKLTATEELCAEFDQLNEKQPPPDTRVHAPEPPPDPRTSCTRQSSSPASEGQQEKTVSCCRGHGGCCGL